MISKWRIASLIGLCLVSTLTCGFSSWIYVANNKADVGDIDVNVGNITTNSTATIVFQGAKLFSFNKYGFAHEEEIIVDDHDKQKITYFDYSYSISTVWQINPTTVTSFEYRTTQKYASSYDFISYSDSDKNKKCTVTSYAQFDSDTFTGSGTGSNSTIAFKNKIMNPTNSLDFTLIIPQSSATQYIMITYQNTVTGLSSAEFESKVFNGSINGDDGHGHTVPVTFDFTLNKVGA